MSLTTMLFLALLHPILWKKKLAWLRQSVTFKASKASKHGPNDDGQ
jgi:hypothetical protein